MIEEMIDDVHQFFYLNLTRKHASKLHALLFVLLGWSLAAIAYYVL